MMRASISENFKPESQKLSGLWEKKCEEDFFKNTIDLP